MKLENEDALDNLIICHQCFTLHEEVPIKDGLKACCSECGTVLYRYDSQLIEYGLSLSITGVIFFVMANFFPLVQIEILGHEQFITIPKTIFSLVDNGFYIVGLLCMFLIFIFPLMIFMINMILFTLLKLRRGEKLSKDLLVLLAYITPWSMTDIFLVSILVALVKLIGYAQIHMGISFFALLAYVMVDLYLVKRIHISEIWMLRKHIFNNGVKV
ncbi:Paraquat-inducible protein A [hydrothermal vent metagenome]|uniref:Paraquat-inducible protein A n=1 Tax=hydrothermal vent metagenome TaxID=652676 RepID=A0A1W1CSC2_9ZZZZ